MTLPASGPLTFADIQTEFGGTNPIALNEYYAGGGLVPAGTSGTYGAVPSSGALSVQNFYGTSAVIPAYIEEVFQTWVYTGNGATQTITNGINLSANGGLVWTKARYLGISHRLVDTARGPYYELVSNDTSASSYNGQGLTSFGTTGYSIDAGGGYNNSGGTYVSWTFQKKPKFFDIVTGTQSVAGNVTVNHNLGSVPACIIVKNTTGSNQWFVYHRSLGTSQYLTLETTDAASSGFSAWGGVAPTSTQFTIGHMYPVGTPFIAYLFAHDAGGFGLTGTDNVISCGSYTGNGSSTGPVVTLGYEPQWIMIKRTDSTGDWVMFDNMRGLTVGDSDAFLFANSSAAESTGATRVGPSATGFYLKTVAASLNASGGNYIYIAIRRGPMKVPTSGTSVFAPVTTSGTGTNNRVITGLGFSPDMIINFTRGATDVDRYTQDRLRGVKPTIYTNTTDAEAATQGIYAVGTLDMTGFTLGTSSGVGFNKASDTYVFECFRRAPSFFDEVCYTGTYPTVNTQTHNLGVAPELMIVKNRSGTSQWSVYSLAFLNSLGLRNRFGVLNTTANLLATDPDIWNNTLATASSFQVNATSTNANGSNFVAYLFATCAGVSKCGLYTGNGSTQTIDCGFGAGGARFVIIKRADSTGSWYVWDSSRGIVSGNDPYLLLNSTAAEVTNTDYIDTYSAGFEISSTAPAEINASGGSFIFLAIS